MCIASNEEAIEKSRSAPEPGLVEDSIGIVREIDKVMVNQKE